MTFLEEVFYHGFYPYDDPNFNPDNYYGWQESTRYIDTDSSYENAVYKAAKIHSQAGGKAYYFGLDGPSSYAGSWGPSWMRFVHRRRFFGGSDLCTTFDALNDFVPRA